MNITLIISLALIVVAIYQSIKIRRLRRQTIEAFKIICEQILKEGEENSR